MFNYFNYKILLCCGATDMRKSINGLSSIVCENFKLGPRDKIIFAFCNKSRNRIKLLVWADNGFWIHLNQKDVELNQKDVELEEKNTKIQSLRKLNN